MGTYSANYNLFLTAEQDEVDVLLNITDNFAILDIQLATIEAAGEASLDAFNAHAADTTGVHGIPDTSLLVTNAQLTDHTSDTTGVHGITDTSLLVTTDTIQTIAGQKTLESQLIVKGAAPTGGTYGADLVPSNVFTNNAHWTTTGWVAGASSATHTVGNTTALSSVTVLGVIGTAYRVRFVVSGRTAGTVNVSIGGASGSVVIADNGTWEFPIVASNTNALTFTPTTDFDGTLATISVQVITPSVPNTTFRDATGATIDFDVRTGGPGVASFYVGQNTPAWTSAGNNFGFGTNALGALTTGTNNLGLGRRPLQRLTSGSFNTGVGRESLQFTVIGSNNTAIGYLSGSNNISGSFNTYIGYNTGVGSTPANLSRTISIGIGAAPLASNVAVIGGTGVDAVSLGIGVGNPLGRLHVEPISSASIGAVVRGVASQGADLQQWQNSSNAVLVAIRPDGRMMFNGYDVQATLGVLTFNSSMPAAIYRGSNGQTANLIDFRDWAGTTLSSVTAAGRIQLGPALDPLHGEAMIKIRPVEDLTSGIVMQRGSATWVNNAAGGTANYSLGQFLAFYEEPTVGDDNNVDSVLFRVDPFGSIGMAGGIHMACGLNGGYAGPYAIQINPSVDMKQLQLIGVAGQTQNVIEYMDSGSNVLFGVTSAGTLVGFAGGYFMPTTSAGYGIQVQARASQTGNLIELLNSSGTTLSKFTGAGRLQIGTGTHVSTAQESVNINTASNQGLVVKGAASQSGDYIQIRTSSDSITARIGSDGFFYGQGVSAAGFYGPFWVDAAQTGSYIGNNPAGSAGGAVQVVTRSAGNIGLAVKGSVSQAVNLQEWQDSTGNPLAFITPTGHANFPSLTVDGNSFDPSGIAYRDQSQTFDEDQWFSGTVAVADQLTVSVNANQSYAIAAYNDTVQADAILGAASGGLSVGVRGLAQANLAQAIRAESGHAGALPLVIQAYQSQTAVITRWQTWTGDPIVEMSAAGDLDFVVTGRGVILVSPNGTRYRVQVDNTGVLSTIAV